MCLATVGTRPRPGLKQDRAELGRRFRAAANQGRAAAALAILMRPPLPLLAH